MSILVVFSRSYVAPTPSSFVLLCCWGGCKSEKSSDRAANRQCVWKWKNIVLILEKIFCHQPEEERAQNIFAKCKYLENEKVSARVCREFALYDGRVETRGKRMKNNPWNNIGDILNSYHHQHINIQQTPLVRALTPHQLDRIQPSLSPSHCQRWNMTERKKHAEIFYHRYHRSHHLILFTANWILTKFRWVVLCLSQHQTSSEDVKFNLKVSRVCWWSWTFSPYFIVINQQCDAHNHTLELNCLDDYY